MTVAGVSDANVETPPPAQRKYLKDVKKPSLRLDLFGGAMISLT
jgi:hypothetical protein